MDNINNNNSVWDESFFKIRKVNQCYSNAISFITEKFLKILKLALPVFLLSSVAITILMYVLCDAELQIKFVSSISFRLLAVFTLYITTSLIITFTYRCIDINIGSLNIYSVGYKFFYNGGFANKFLKALLINFTLFGLVIIILLATHLVTNLFLTPSQTQTTVYSEQLFVKKWIIRIVMATIFIVLTIPWHMALNTVMFKNNNILNNIWKGYVMGWKKWGKIFALDLMTTITIIILILFLVSPAYVISLMQHSATLSRLQGDAVNIPDYFSYITIAILFITSFFLNILFTFKYLPQAYLYSSFIKEMQLEDKKK